MTTANDSGRRGFLAGMSTAVAWGTVAAGAQAQTATAASAGATEGLPALPPLSPQAPATDAGYWAAVKALYRVNNDLVNLENGYWGVMTESVNATYLAKSAMINRDNSIYARTQFGKDADVGRRQLAAALGVQPEEIAFTRGATEALQLLIGGFNKLKPGDTVLHCDLDYDSMQYAMNWLQDRRGVKSVKFNIPEPATKAAVLEAYDQALRANPGTRLLLLTHVSHRTGLAMPVAEIAAMAKARGAEVILDAAHSWGQMDFKATDFGVDFIGFNLHKWIGAPLGVGCLYIAKHRLNDIDRAYGDEDWPASDIRSRVHTGTYNFAAYLTLPAALSVHQAIGPRAKALRLRYLRDRWVSRVRDLVGIEVLTPDEPGMSAGITSFRLAGKTSAADNNAVVTRLKDQYGIFTVRRGGVAKGQCIRVSPALYNDERDMDRLAAALREMVRG